MMKGWQRAPATIMGCSADFRLTVLKNNSSLVKKASASPKDANVAPAIGRENYLNLACVFPLQNHAAHTKCGDATANVCALTYSRGRGRITHCRWPCSAGFLRRTSTGCWTWLST